MKKIQVLFAALIAVAMTSCINFKTEASVDVTVMKDGQPQSNVTVYKFVDNGLGEGQTIYKDNAKGAQTTNAAGVAHFELKSPDDLDPSDIGLSDRKTFYFCTYDKDNVRNGFVAVEMATGQMNKPVTLLIEPLQEGDE
jgi:subtilase family serine protease